MLLYSRFLRQEGNEFIASTQRIRYPAFMPNWETEPVTGKRFLSKSIFNVDSLSEPDIWTLAQTHVPTVKARGDIQQNDIVKIGLRVDQNNIPSRHANILDWDESEDGMAREKNKSFAINLANCSKLVIR